MLNTRQISLLKKLRSEDKFFEANSLAVEFGVSSKTIRTDLKAIREDIEHYGATICSITGKGSSFELIDEELFESYLHTITDYSHSNINFSEQSMRIEYIIKKLIMSNSYISTEKLADEMYISKSRIASDLAQAKKVFAKYGLEIISRQKYGIMLSGSEVNKRLCIVKEKISIYGLANMDQKEENDLLKEIGNIVVETLVDGQYRISDVVIQNLVLHIFVSLKRMQQEDYIENEMNLEDGITFHHELKIAQEIMRKIDERFHIKANDSEVIFLAINLKGKRNYDENNIISEETNVLVLDILDSINEKMHIDLSGNMELRISLALHIMPLVTRVKYNHMLSNHMVSEIRQTLPLAFDAAVIAADQIANYYNIKLDENELGYLAIHFSVPIQEYYSLNVQRKVLILCSSRRGETLLMRHKFLSWFKEQISELKVANFIELKYLNLDDYDLIFSTSLIEEGVPSNAIKINFFLTNDDFERINRAMIGESSQETVMEYFHKDLFFHVTSMNSKNKVLKMLCDALNAQYEYEDDLYDCVLRREEMGFTAFGNHIAVPHPDHLIAKQTSVAVMLLDKPLAWDESNVRIVFLVCVAKQKEKDLKTLFEYISMMMLNEKAIQRISKYSTYDVFVEELKNSIK
jgi:lichenan operon transcriptional antiterminator